MNEWHRCVSLRVPDLILLMPRLVKPTKLLKDTEWVSARFWRFTERTVSFWYSAEITFVHSSFIRSLYCSIKYLNTNTGLLNPKLKGAIFKHFYIKMSKTRQDFYICLMSCVFTLCQMFPVMFKPGEIYKLTRRDAVFIWLLRCFLTWFDFRSTLSELSTQQRLLFPLFVPPLLSVMHSLDKEHFPSNIIVYKHLAMNVSCAGRCCSHVEKQEWR